MSDDNHSKLLATPKRVSTSTVGRLFKTAAIGVTTGLSALRSDSRAGGVFASADPRAIEKMVTSLGELKGIAMKMGQILSYADTSLPPETREMLRTLQRWSAVTEWAEVEATIRADLETQRANELCANIDRVPLASASVGQVHRAQIDGQSLAVKVRHPGIEDAMKADFRAALPSALIGRLIAPGSDVKELMREAREGFLSECDYEREAASQERFGEIFRDDPVIQIPRVWSDYSGARVLTTSFVKGQSLEEFLKGDPPQERRDEIARALYRFYVGTLYRYGYFNADPHPGNLVFAEDGHLAIIDHGCVRHFEPEVVAALVRLSKAVQSDERERIVDALVVLGVKAPEDDAAYETTRDMLRGFYEPVLVSGRTRVTIRDSLASRDIVAMKMKLMRMHIPGKLLFLFRIRFGLYALLSQLEAELDWRALENELHGG